MGSLAGIAAYFTHFRCMDTLAMARNQSEKQGKIFWPYLHHHVYMEHSHYLVDMECIAPRSIGAFFANSLMMCFPWLGFKIAKKWLGEKTGYVSLIAFWMCFEYIHLHDWGLSWPWLTLGNVFATHPEWIQWYEYTGTSGGTLWIMIVNILLFLHIKNNFNRGPVKSYKNLIAAVLILIIPVGYLHVFISCTNGCR